DQFTDITQLAKVEKGSSRSGRRVAEADEEDLSMTEVPDKQTEGTGTGRGRTRRGRGRSTEEPAAARAASEVRPSTGLAPASPPLVVLPGEKLSRVAAAAGAGGTTAADGAASDEAVPADDALAGQVVRDGEAVATGEAPERQGEGEGRRRRRRRG